MKIVFVCESVYERPAKIAATLCLSGLPPDLLTIHEVPPDWKRYFGAVKKISNLNELAKFDFNFYSTIHHFSKSVDQLTLVLLRTDKKFVYDYKDVFPKVLSLESPHWNEDALRLIVRKKIPVSYRDGQFNRYLTEEGFTPTQSSIHLPDFIWPTQLNKLTGLHYGLPERTKRLVFIGNFSIETIEPQFKGMGQFPIINSLLGQGLYFTMFPFRHDQRQVGDASMADYRRLAMSNSRFALLDPIQAEALPEELAKFGWGCHLLPMFHFTEYALDHHLILPAVGKASRYSDFLGAGLPLIVSQGLVEIADWVECYGLGIVVNQSSLSTVADRIRSVDYAKLKSNVKAFVNDSLNPIRFGRELIAFYNSL